MKPTVGDLRDFEGKSWTAWTDYLGYGSPPDSNETDDCEDVRPSCTLLNRADIGIYGRYPFLEPFCLVQCDYCGEKLKKVVIARHISARHPDGKKVKREPSPSKQIVPTSARKSKQKTPRSPKELAPNPHPPVLKVRKSKKSLIHLEEDKNEPAEIAPPLDVFIPLPAAFSSRPIYIKPETTPKSKKKDEIASPNSKAISKGIIKGIINGSNLETIIPPSKDKKTELVKKRNLKVAPALEKVGNSTVLKITSDDRTKKVEVKAIVKVIPPEPPIEPNEQIIKKRAKEKKGFSVKDREYDPDRHCGVIVEDNGKPCTRSLTCKFHSLSLRRSVPGRCKRFDILLAEKKTLKQKERIGYVEEKKPLIEPSLENSPISLKLPPSVSPPDIKNEQYNSPRSCNGSRSEDSHPPLSLPVSIKNPSLLVDIIPHQARTPPLIPEKTPPHIVERAPALDLERTLPHPDRAPPLIPERTSPLISDRKRKLSIDASPERNQTETKRILSSPDKGTLLWYPKKKRRSKEKCKKKPVVEKYRQWNPWFRRYGGLLYAQSNIPMFSILPNNKFKKDSEDGKQVQRHSSHCNNHRTSLRCATDSQVYMLDDIKNISFNLAPENRLSTPFSVKNDSLNIVFPPNGGSFVINSQKLSPQFLIQKKFDKLSLEKYCFGKEECAESSDSEADRVMEEEPTDPGFSLLAPIKPIKDIISLCFNGVKSNSPTESRLPCSEDPSIINLGVGTLINGQVLVETVERLHFVTPSGPTAVSLKQQLPLPDLILKKSSLNSCLSQSLNDLELISPNLSGLMFPLESDDDCATKKRFMDYLKLHWKSS